MASSLGRRFLGGGVGFRPSNEFLRLLGARFALFALPAACPLTFLQLVLHLGAALPVPVDAASPGSRLPVHTISPRMPISIAMIIRCCEHTTDRKKML